MSQCRLGVMLIWVDFQIGAVRPVALLLMPVPFFSKKNVCVTCTFKGTIPDNVLFQLQILERIGGITGPGKGPVIPPIRSKNGPLGATKPQKVPL